MPTAPPDSAIRRPALAGTFYAATAADLNAQLDASFAARVIVDAPPPKALIAPHAGLIYSGPVAASAYASLLPDATKIRRIVLLGPSHHVGFRGFVLPTTAAWQTPLGTIDLDTTALDALSLRPDVQRRDAPHAPEHSLEVHLPFLQRVLDSFVLVPVLVGQISAEQGASLLREVWGGDETRIVISSDLSHFFPQARAQVVDAETTAAIEALDPTAMLAADACGRYPAAGLLLEARQRGMTVRTIDVRTSGDTSGDLSRVVGYGSYLFWPKGVDSMCERPVKPGDTQPKPAYTPAQRQLLGQLARQSIEDGLSRGADLDRSLRPMPLDLTEAPAWLRAKAATFVTIERPRGRLRGCIGTLTSHQALGQDVVDHAFAAAFRDPRFPPLSRTEQAGLALHLSVLSAPQPFPVRDEADACARLRPNVDGVVLTSGRHRATFLPQVWESLRDPHEFLTALRQKAGLAPQHWPVTLQTYTVESWHTEGSRADVAPS